VTWNGVCGGVLTDVGDACAVTRALPPATRMREIVDPR
jgi:hypothetical protein